MLNDKQLKNVQAMLASCDELINGRFIFAENIIKKILSNISESDELYQLITECMKNFNYDKELNRARIKLPTKNGYFVMPESKAVIIPFVFCLLVDIRDGKISFREFLKNYFIVDDISEFENFAKSVIIPFKEAITYCFDLDKKITEQPSETYSNNESNVEEEIEQEQSQERKMASAEVIVSQIEEDEKAKKLVVSVKRVCTEIQAQVSIEKKLKQEIKDDALYLLNCLTNACEKMDMNEINAFIIALNYVLQESKSAKFLVKELNQNLVDFYS